MTTPKRRNTADEAIQTLDQLFICHINEGDADALVESFYAEEALLLPPNHPTVVGRTRIRDFWLGLLEAGLGDLSLDSAERWASRNLAYATGAYTLAIRRKVGEPVRDNGKWLVTYRRQSDSSWRAINHMFSSDQAAA